MLHGYLFAARTPKLQSFWFFLVFGDFVVVVLVDWFGFLQVESLTAARSAFKAGTEPSDAIRVVNAVLTQIDQIKRYCLHFVATAKGN